MIKFAVFCGIIILGLMMYISRPLNLRAEEGTTPPPLPAEVAPPPVPLEVEEAAELLELYTVPDPEPLSHTAYYWPPYLPLEFYQHIQYVENPYDRLVLVNKNNRLSPDFSPSDLRLVQVLDFYNRRATTIFLRDPAATAAEALFAAAWEEDGLVLWARSGYRSFSRQERTHRNFVNSRGQAQADRFSARAGHSEHQAGVALDVTSASVNGHLTATFGQTAEGLWLRHNAHRFGFIIRYPEDREDETGYAYEPWHIRYVGKESAEVIFRNELILEQYLIGRIVSYVSVEVSVD